MLGGRSESVNATSNPTDRGITSNASGTSTAVTSSDVHIQVKICKAAGHMSFVKKKDGQVGKFFHKEVLEYVLSPSATSK